MFRYYNANSKNNFINDCVIRAVSTVEEKTWNETYKELSILAMKKGLLLDDVNFVRPLLDSKYKRTCSNNETIGQFADKHKKGKYLLTTKGHITSLIDGNIVDTWDCRNKVLECAWKVE